MPQVPSSHSYCIRQQAKLLPKYFSKSLTDLATVPKVSVAELLKPHDLIPLQDSGSFGEQITVVFESKNGTQKLVLDEICGR